MNLSLVQRFRFIRGLFIVLIISLPILLQICGCSSATLLKPIDPKQDTLKGTVWAFDYDFSTSRADPEESCQIVLLKAENHEGFRLQTPLNQKSVITSLDPGRYILREIYCNANADWRFFGKPVVIQIIEGKINYLGVRIAETDTLQNLHLEWTKPSTLRKNSFALELNPEDRTRLVYAGNGKSLFQ
jgi:hypothetical protein